MLSGLSNERAVMAVRPKDRFEVFKRDGFTCQYCGRNTPDVVLEVDHVIPRAEGGGDELENLATACWDCNRGKGAGLLGERAPVRDLDEQADLILEREAQLRVYNDAKRAERERKEADYFLAYNHWFDVWNADRLERYYIPWESTLKHYIERLGVEDVMDAMDIAGGKFQHVRSDSVKYFVGVLKGKLAEREGRVAYCDVCGGRMNLSPEEARQGVSGWYHVACKEKNG